MSETGSTLFMSRLSMAARDVAACLDARISAAPLEGEIARPTRLVAAMRHGALNGGKRLRPFLVLEAAELLGGARSAALRVATALECVHCYSLIHDDLPAMDDDALRRGQPTVHMAFDEATAILAGDALLTLAFDILSDSASGLAPATAIDIVQRLARASGVGGMAGGQALDLAAETETLCEAEVVAMQAMKTGALLRFACEAGAVSAGASRADIARLSRFGEIVGLAFQLADDLLDVTSDVAKLGKAAGKDARRGKATFVALHGVEATRHRLGALVAEASALLAPFGPRGEVLDAAARYIAERDN